MPKINLDNQPAASKSVMPVSADFIRDLHSRIKFFVKRQDGSYSLQTKSSNELQKLLMRAQSLN